MTPDIGHHVKSLFEIVFEANSNNGGIGTDVERGQLGYDLNDDWTVWVGRFHTPYGVWNTAYHHGKELLPTISRPRFLDFEDSGGVLPSHSVGWWLHGKSDNGGSGRFKYDLFVANGSRIVTNAAGTGGISDFNLLKTDHPNAEVGANVGYQFRSGSLDGLTVGINAYQTVVNSYVYSGAADTSVYSNTNLPNAMVSQVMTGAYANYESDRFDASFEYYGISDTNRMPSFSDSHQNSFYFIQTDYAVTPKIHPYAMFEKASIDANDTYFQNLIDSMSYIRTSLGVRYDLSAEACVKAGWWETTQTNTPGMAFYTSSSGTALTGTGIAYYNRWSVQFAVRF